ncbi:hypothetical protein JX265_004315 [Neoarthrinium moseri]|uniref:ubiquitinyl hydrolase 1 n=1 Tax=Neoarthrinium moseri TaxID=1658444 RepID=A0A9P9WQT2_9PEZI|nr:uncharacterized protein JN550_001891 [Neoarthrinium moseri]KAI1875257.1 hypothetical protein JX265_004315 [Neoarthrinium moseri]KAI1875605.1 hypothetical protein JN550_001891 [Neoarthrinium moseri]
MNPHLPAGQPMPGGVGGMGMGGRGPGDMGPGPGPHTANGPRRRPQYAHQQHSYGHHNHNQPIYYQNSHMNPYASAYYPQAPPHYPAASMPGNPYMQYNAYAARSPPAMHQQQYPSIVSSTMSHPPQPYSRPPPQQPSPAISTPPPYHMAQPPPPLPIPQTPSSTHSSQAIQAPLTPPTPQSQESVPPPQPEHDVVQASAPFRPPLPWLSHPDLPFPVKAARSRRRRRIMASETEGVQLPANQQAGIETLPEPSAETEAEPTAPKTPTLKEPVPAQPLSASTETLERPETPSTQDLPSEGAQSTSPTTPVSTHTTQASIAASITPTQSSKSASKAAAPAVPIVPILPKSSPKDAKTVSSVEQPAIDQKQTQPSSTPDSALNGQPVVPDAVADVKDEPAAVPVRAAPKSWASLLASKTSAPAGAARNSASASAANGSSAADGATGEAGSGVAGSFSKSNASSQAEALRAFTVGNSKLAFLEPRGLINTGNMCYMNSVLQVLIFCIPFYDFLDQVSKKAAHSFNSETPLIDAMIMFMREYKVIDSAVSVDQLRRRLKTEELEQYGEPFTPEFVYEAIRKLPRFASMRHGHQQDAEEFLGFLLEALHDECTRVMRHLPDASSGSTAGNSSVTTPAANSPTDTSDSSAWLEVGRKQRAAVTRSSGHPITSSPITKIFGGQLRSELRVTALKDSVTLEPYQPLQLDIDSPNVRNIVDALKNLTRAERLQGDFGSPRGPDAVAHKQVFIESLPPVLILHLKRFQFDAKGGTVKIWKKIGYPLELEIPAEVISRQKRSTLFENGNPPKYRLIASVYHHGKNASGGHYTADVRRQDGREWIRLDDTVIRRVRSEDVAEGGAEEDANKHARSENKKEAIVGGSGNRFEGIGDDDAGEEEGWNKVSAPAGGAKKWSSVVNGSPNPAVPAPKPVKDNKADNKVAYLLFYQRV